MGGVSALPRAQGWCGRALGSSGTWLALEFYCEPARAWHSHENGCGRTGGRKERMKEGRVEGRRGAAEEGAEGKKVAAGEGSGRGGGAAAQQRCVVYLWFWVVCRGNDFKGGLVG